jgi:hypothetical protein
MSDEPPNPHQDDGSAYLGESPESCEFCGQSKFGFNNNGKEWYCNECGMENKLNIPDKGDQEPKYSLILNEGADPDWENSSYVFVPAREKRQYALSKNPKLPEGWMNNPELDLAENDFSQERDLFRQSMALLGMNRQANIPNRSAWYRPLFDIHPSPTAEISDAKYDPRLPGPVFRMLMTSNLPSRGYYLLPVETHLLHRRQPDSIRPDFRVPFEMYIYLNREIKRPWPLSEWISKVRIRNRIDEILNKGGALSRKCGALFQEIPISEEHVRGYMENLDRMNEFNSPNNSHYIDEAMKIISAMQQSEEDFYSWFMQNLCTVVRSDSTLADFWIFGKDRNRADIGHLQLQSIIVGLAVHTVIAREGNEADRTHLDRLKKFALADEEFSAKNAGAIQAHWSAILDNLEL